MSAINSKSITGITSITTPPGVDNIFTVHSNDTTERFRVDQSGNQNLSGIITASNFKTGVSNLHNLGLTLSSGQLDVGSNIKLGNAGIITASGFKLSDGSNVGGVESDAQRNTVGGTNAGDSFSGTDATDNTIFGYNAGTSLTTGDKNVIIGAYAAKSVTTVGNFVAIGHSAYSSQVSSNSGTVAIGHNALQTYTGSFGQVAIGKGAGQDAGSSGGNNTLIGENAGYGCKGFQCTIVGYHAGSASNTQSGQTIIGHQAHYFGNQKAGNTAVGKEAMMGVSGGNGSQTTAIGYEALKVLNNGGNQNTALGYQAGDKVNTGTSNVIIGYSAASTGTNDLTNGSNNIIIGGNAAVSSATVSNEITLGNSSINHFRIPGIGVSFSEGGGVTTGIMTASAFKLLDGSSVGGVESDAQGNTVGGTNSGDSFSGTSAIKNTLFGYNSGTAITSGDQNTSFGYDALKTMTTTESNTAVGFEALRVATGDLGAAFGSMALRSDNGNGYNCAFGAMSGYSVTSGSDNSFLGYTAGQNLETGNYNICLGAWSRTSSTSVSRECTIGGNQNSRTIQSFRIPGIGLTISSSSNSPFPTSGSQLHLPGNAEFVGIVTATAFVSSQGTLTNRNKIINGDFTVHQRGGTIASSNGNYTLDRWRTYRAGGSSGGFSVQQSTSSYPQTNISGVIDNFKASAFITVTSAGSADTNNNCKFQQRIEGSNVYDLAFGTVAAKKVTVSFYVKCSLTGDFGISLVNENHNRSNVQLYTVNSATTWERKIVTFNGDTSGTWTFGTGTGLQLMFDMGSGSDKHTSSLNTWVSGEKHGTSSSVKLIHTNGATIQFAGVQLEAGEVATPFEFRSHAEELQLCERYYQKYGAQRHSWMTNVNGTDHFKMVYFPTTMRISPTMNLYDQSVDGSSVSAHYVSPNGYSCRLNGNGRHASWKHEATAEL